MAYSPECNHGLCAACRYEDCDCRCHNLDWSEIQPDEPAPEDESDEAR